MIQAAELSSSPSLRHGFFTRQGGHSAGLFASLNCGFGSGDDKEVVARNRTIVVEALGTGAPSLLTAWQWHSADVVVAGEPWDSRYPPKADAIVTAVPRLAVGILTADCAPVLFADAAAGVVGAAHAGWKGALNGVTDATVSAMETMGARRKRIVAVVGPTISQANYEVGPEFKARFEEQDAANARFFIPSLREGHVTFDLPAYLLGRLTMARLGQVSSVGLCTYAEQDRFFSYRRTTHRDEKDYGRQISAIALAG